MVDVGDVVVGGERERRQVTTRVQGGAALDWPLLVEQVLHVGDSLALPQELLVDRTGSSSSSSWEVWTPGLREV